MTVGPRNAVDQEGRQWRAVQAPKMAPSWAS